MRTSVKLFGIAALLIVGTVAFLQIKEQEERFFLKVHREEFNLADQFELMVQTHLGPQYQCLKEKGQPCQDAFNKVLADLPKDKRQEKAMKATKELLKLAEFLKENKKATGADIEKFLKTSGILDGENGSNQKIEQFYKFYTKLFVLIAYWKCMAEVFKACDSAKF